MSAPPKFTPAKVDTKKTPTSPAAKKTKPEKPDKKDSKKSTKKGSKIPETTEAPPSINTSTTTSNNDQLAEKDRIIADRDREIAALQSKVKKYEAELRRSDDTILVQEEEIKRLTKKLSEGGAASSNGASAGAAEDPEGTGTGTESMDDPGSEKGSSGSRKVKSSGGGSSSSSSKTTSSTGTASKRADRSKREATSLGGGSKSFGSGTNNTYALSHMNLREGHMKEAFSDLALTIVPATSGGNAGTLNGHASIVSVRCQKFDKALKERYDQGKGKKAKPIPKKKALDLRGSDVATVSRVLDYMYSDECPWLPKLKAIDLLNLVIAARRYSLDRLEWICENHILETLGLENVVVMLKGANELKEDRIKKFCLDFLLQPETFKDFVLRKDLTAELGMELFSELVTLNATSAATGGIEKIDRVKILGKCPEGRIKEDLRDLFQNMLYADASVKLDGETIQFHKGILAGASKHIYENFSRGKLTAGGMEEVGEFLELEKDQRFFEKISAEAFRSLLKFVYYGEPDIEALPACLLIPFVRYYGLNELQELCEKIIQQSVSNSKVVLKILAVTYLAIMAAREDMRDRLRRDCVSHVVTNLKEVNLLEIKGMDKDFALDLALDLLLACQKNFG